jgi:hypothetical protein
MASIAEHGPVADFPQGSVAFTAGERGDLAQHLIDLHVCQRLCRNGLEADLDRHLGRGTCRLVRQARQQRRHLGNGAHMVDVDIVQGVARAP